VQKTGSGIHVEARLLNMKTRQAVFGKGYDGSAANPRLYAHKIADELYQQQRALRGVAETKLTFDSDRDGERMVGTVEKRNVKEIYIADYDGENQRRVTTGRSLNITPKWSPDGRSIAYTSYRHGPGNIFISNIYQGTLEELTKGPSENWLPFRQRTQIAATRAAPITGHASYRVMQASANATPTVPVETAGSPSHHAISSATDASVSAISSGSVIGVDCR